MGDSCVTYRFGVRHDRAWGGWHIGVNFCVGHKNMFGNRDIYLFVCIGKHDFSIGFINFWEEQYGESENH